MKKYLIIFAVALAVVVMLFVYVAMAIVGIHFIQKYW
jgi:hypothetical protein